MLCVRALCAPLCTCLCVRDKMRAANPGFLDTTLGLLFTHAYGMPEHRADVEFVFQRLDRPLPQVRPTAVHTICIWLTALHTMSVLLDPDPATLPRFSSCLAYPAWFCARHP